MRFAPIFVILACFSVVGVARADEPFTLSATGGSTTVDASGSHLTNLVGNLINGQNQFASLNGQALNASLRYGSLDNSILFTRNAAGTSGTISIPSQNLTKTFTAANQDDLKSQMKHFFGQDAVNGYGRYLAVVNAHSSLGVTDGNPLATTALMADSSYYRFGFQPPRFDLTDTQVPAGMDIKMAAGNSSSTDGDGWYADGGVGGTIRFTDRVGLSISVDARYREVNGAAIYEAENTDALPILLIEPGFGGGWSWTVTPAFVIGFGGSWDLAAGGFPIGGQITSSLSYQAGPWTFVMANQYGYYNGLNIDVSDFQYDTDVDQSICKNGLQAIYSFNRAFIDAGITYTNFLNNAAVSEYWSPVVGVGVHFGNASGVRLGYHGDFGPGFTNNGADLQFFFAY